MTLIDHFAELRTRLFVSLGAWVVAAGITFIFRFRVLAWLQAPLPDAMTLNYFSILEPFVTSMQIASFFGLVLASPAIVSQIWGFIAPGLYPEERRYAVPFIALTALAFASGVLFSYYVVLPFTIPILLGFLGEQAQGLLSIGRYITNLLTLMAVFGVMFEMPVLAFLLARIGLLQHPVMVRQRKWALVTGLALAAVITPTGDPFNFALVAGPLVILYELSIVVVRLSQRKERHGTSDPEPPE
ncbi:MAG: twin-arginine translocase subunit TatC [Trueperaceae bacterium]|nr:twin-arginine translocase subunit TatC [Trueperaceae bacterium]